MMTNLIERPKVVSQADWLSARKELLMKEKQLTRQRDEIDRQRRELPWVKIEKNYIFYGPNGQQSLADLFGAHSSGDRLEPDRNTLRRTAARKSIPGGRTKPFRCGRYARRPASRPHTYRCHPRARTSGRLLPRPLSAGRSMPTVGKNSRGSRVL